MAKTVDDQSAVSFLSESDALEDGLCLGGAGVWRWKIDSDQLEWSKNLEGVHHLPPGSFDGTLSSFQQDVHPDDAADVWQQIMASVETGAPYRAVYRTAPRRNEQELWIETSGGLVTQPDGTRYLTGICLDVSERVRKDHQLKRRLAQQNAVASFGSSALNEVDFQNVLNDAVRLAAETLDVPLTKILHFSNTADHLVLRAGIGWAEGLVGHGKVGIERESQAGYTLLANKPIIVRDLPTETRFSGPPLLREHGVRSGISVVIPGTEGRPFGVFGIHSREPRGFDQTDAEFVQSIANIVAGAARQVAAADHHMLLVREMAHRAGNMLQLVTSIAAQTLNVGTSADIRLARDNFSARLSALARSNYVVARGGWTSTRFSELADEALRPFKNQVVAEGRDILLPPELCFDMGLVLHELATNSVKYGTLGRDEGSVTVNWGTRALSDGLWVFTLEWNDPLSSSSTRSRGTGFGSKLLSALVEKKWNGVVTTNDAPHFRITLEIPLTH